CSGIYPRAGPASGRIARHLAAQRGGEPAAHAGRRTELSMAGLAGVGFAAAARCGLPDVDAFAGPRGVAGPGPDPLARAASSVAGSGFAGSFCRLAWGLAPASSHLGISC